MKQPKAWGTMLELNAYRTSFVNFYYVILMKTTKKRVKQAKTSNMSFSQDPTLKFWDFCYLCMQTHCEKEMKDYSHTQDKTA